MEVWNMAQIKRLGSAVLLILCLFGCTEKEEIPDSVEIYYPYTIASTENARVVIAEKGSDPVLFFEILRRASESLESYEFVIGDTKIPDGEITVTPGRVWDRDDIRPEGVIDLFSATVRQEGSITARISAKYDSGKVYNNEITFEYGYN